MIKRILFVLLAAALGCTNDSSQQEPTPDSPMINQEDMTPPSINIVGLETGTIEVLTTLELEITDESEETTTTISVNGEEFFSSSIKSFSYELDPFDFPTGATTISITSTDSAGNQISISETIQLARLVASIAAESFAPERNQLLYYSVNTLDGALVQTVQVENPFETVKLYAGDDFGRQEFVITSYQVFTEDFAFLRSIANIEPGTDLVALQEEAGITTENDIVEPTEPNEIRVDISDFPDDELCNSLAGQGADYFASFTENSNVGATSQVRITTRGANASPEDVFIYNTGFECHNNTFSVVDEYRYLFLDDFVDSSASFLDFTIPDFRTANLPNGATGFNFALLGYANQVSFEANQLRFLYLNSTSNQQNPNIQGIEIPIIPEYPIVVNSAIVFLSDGKTLTSTLIGENTEINIPNWQALRNGDTVEVTGDFDACTFRTGISGSNNRLINWSYDTEFSQLVTIPFDSFEIPQELLDTPIGSSLNFSSLNSNSSLNISLRGSSEDLSYEQFIFASQITNSSILGNAQSLRIDL